MSGQIQATTPIATVLGGVSLVANSATPAAVTGLSAVRGDRQVTLTWTAPANTGGSPIRDYLVQFRTRSAGLMNVRSAFQVETYQDPGTGAAGYSHSSLLARTDLWAGSLLTMQRIRSSIRWIGPPN